MNLLTYVALTTENPGAGEGVKPQPVPQPAATVGPTYGVDLNFQRFMAPKLDPVSAAKLDAAQKKEDRKRAKRLADQLKQKKA